jgi:hypothetical protein
MRVRQKGTSGDNWKMTSGKFNVCALSEVICYWEDGSADSLFIKDLDVFIEARTYTGNHIGWKDMRQAFEDKDIIIDNFNTYFFEPENEEDRKRGFTL